MIEEMKMIRGCPPIHRPNWRQQDFCKKTQIRTTIMRRRIEAKESCQYIEIIFEEASHSTPCHASPHGSPAAETQPGRFGVPKAAYKLLIAATMLKQNIETLN